MKQMLPNALWWTAAVYLLALSGFAAVLYLQDVG